MKAGIQDVADSKPMKKVSARKRSQGFKKKERKKGGGGNFLACSVFAVKNQPTHSTRLKNVMVSLVGRGVGGQGKTLSTAWDQGCFCQTLVSHVYWRQNYL